MWKISRNLIFSRWHASNKKYVENNGKTVIPPKAVVTFPTFEKKRHSGESNKGKEHFNKQSRKYWNCEQFQNLLSRSFFLETAGWLGTVTALCFNFHFKHFSSFYKHERGHSNCLFSRNVLAMPNSTKQESLQSDVPIVIPPSCSNDSGQNNSKVHSTADQLTSGVMQYSAVMQNSAGLSVINSNSKKAFRYFQASARLGSSQGFYNLGLCYELGKGTRINLNRAAFCFKKAAMKGHGLAAFNLAIYFYKGMGGLPVDHDTARLLLAEAAEKDIPEALVYIGLDCLEEKKWSDAFQIFKSLDTKNVLDGKYYLGLCYENGWGVKRDEKVATELYSEGSTLGHSKSILRLSKCYEEGFGGCNPDLDFAMALCQLIAEEGDEEGRILLTRLKIKQQAISLKNLFDSNSPPIRREKSNLHNSSSVPEIAEKSQAITNNMESFTSAYLDVITPYLPNKQQSPSKATFFIGEKNPSMTLPSVFVTSLQSNRLPNMTVAKS